MLASFKRPISMDPLFDTYSANSSLCHECKENYVNLTGHFKSLGAEKKLCMDVVDLVLIFNSFLIMQLICIFHNIFNLKFNYTRITWSKGYKCNYRNIDELNVVMINGAVLVFTALFYIFVRVVHRKDKHTHLNHPHQHRH